MMKSFLAKASLSPKAFLARIALLAFIGVMVSAPLRAPLSALAQAAPQPQIVSMSVDDKNDFVLEPGKMEMFVDPGQKIVKYISVTSRINKKTDFAITTEDFIGSRDENSPVLLLGADKSPYSFKDSLKPAVSEFSLDFGDRITVPVTIDVPANAQPGGYYASVIVSNNPSVLSGSSTTGTARVISRVGVLFFVRVNGVANESGYVEDFRLLDSRAIYSTSPSPFQILFNNTGTVHLAPYGTISITNMFGSKIAMLPVDAYFSMPDSLRYRDVAWNDSGFRLGRYKATLELHRGYGDLIDTKVIAFWIIPWKIIIPVIVGIFLIVGLAYIFLSRFELRRKK